MKALVDILKGIDATCHSRVHLQGAEVAGLGFDSRLIAPKELFVALRGTKLAGLRFSSEALQKGAIGIVFHHDELPMLSTLQYQYPDRHFIAVDCSAEALGRMASNFYDHPSQKLSLLGVTGTNGKTTIATLLQRLLLGLGEGCGLLSTVVYDTGASSLPATHTTPDAVSLQKLLAETLKQGARYACIEVSSHAIAQRRISGLSFRGGIISNITHDHLDYHKDFLDYVQVKKRFFDQLPDTAFALINVDDKNGNYMLQNCKAAQQKGYALQRSADYKGRVLSDSIHGMEMEIQQYRAMFSLSGTFNAYNLLAVAAAAHLLGIELVDCLRVLSGIKGVKGRFECVPNDRGLHVVIDFAHTPDALQQVLSSLAQFAKQEKQSRLISVLGCGGNKDQLKRAKMGKIACQYSYKSFFTSDNPRDEDPRDIISDMQKALTQEERSRVSPLPDRTEAIQKALQIARRGDFVLIAGKGHEEYQEIAGSRHAFSDKRIVESQLQTL